VLHAVCKIRDYGLIGDCRAAALVSRRGSIDWCCLPLFDSPSVFGALLDRERGGFFSLAPVGGGVGRQAYLGETNILTTEFRGTDTVARVVDFFSVATEEHKRERAWPCHELMRVVEGVKGRTRFLMRFAPRPDYGREKAQLARWPRFGLVLRSGHELFILRAERELLERCEPRDGPEGPEAAVEFEVGEGERVAFSLVHDDDAPAVLPPLGEGARERRELTSSYWREWISRCRFSGRHAREVRRSALCLKLLTFAPSGGIVAAPTTSLPEAPGGRRNWDYRYCWLRDSAFTARALMRLGYLDEAIAYVNWLIYTTRLTWPRLQVLYTVYGHNRTPEQELTFLHGYEGAHPVRIGNDAHDQLQLDVYGEVLDAIYTLLPHLDVVDSYTRKFLRGIGRTTRELWDEPDNGIWEVRSRRVHHTHSKVMSWVAADRLEKLTTHYRMTELAHRYAALKAAIRDAVERHGYHEPGGYYSRAFGTRELDAAALTFPLVGYCDADAPRMASTIHAILRRLARGCFVYRYRRVNDGIPGGGREGAFGICGFWLVQTLARAGRLDEARAWFDSQLTHANEVGLWPEEIEPTNSEFLGNYPQAFTHIGLINAACELEECGEKRMLA
jgi:GH15 family glucan-1,4-alpha-glucosidase